MAHSIRFSARAALLLAAAMVVASSPALAASRNGRRLRQATAIATSRAVAAPGATAVSNVRAGAVSTGGAPATAVAQGASIAEAGQTVRTECNVYAVDTEQYKACINTSPAAKANTSANATAAAQAGVVSWEAAPLCTPPVINYTPDDYGRLWGYQNGTSCVFRFTDGTPVFAANLTAGAAGAAAGAAVFETAPACRGLPTATNSTADSAGRLWGSQDGVSCAYKNAAGQPLGLPAAEAPGVPPGAGAGAAASAVANATAVSRGASANATAGANATSSTTKRRRHLLA